MIVRRHSTGYNFWGDTATGLTLRWGEVIGDNPVYAPWPELADISISNHCSKGCDFCYKDSRKNNTFMSLEQYERVLDALKDERWGSVFQVALGGGEPLEHPDFEKIIKATYDRGVVVNFTTNGIFLDKDIIRFLKGKIGALAISVADFSELNIDILRLLRENEIKTNIHFILDNESINEGVKILKGEYNELVRYVNSVIFLTFKAKGRASAEKSIQMDYKLKKFLKWVNRSKSVCSIGFDACFVPLLMKYTCVNVDFIDSCECGFFSVYIDENMNVKPCSFTNNDNYSYNLNEFNFKVIWAKKYEQYRREVLKMKCNSNECSNKNNCRGKCSYFDELSFCYVS